jgi:uncharacterized protein
MNDLRLDSSLLARRAFLRRAGGWVVAPSLMTLLARCTTDFGERAGDSARRVGYGRLRVRGDARQLKIPEGFRVSLISTTGRPSKANPRFTVPIAFDGTAAFAGPNGTVRLVRNHEVQDPAESARPFAAVNVYDPKCGGGTTTVELRIGGSTDGPTIEVVREHPSLVGTLRNCAGGATPWGSWLSCEETTEERERKHGYVFEVPSAAYAPVEPIPLTAMGRFVHEAVAVDPRSGIVYQTEDIYYEPKNNLPGAGFYRFIPERERDLRAGRLEMLAVTDHPNFVTARGQKVGAVLPVRWVPIEDPDPADAAENRSSVFHEGQSKGAALFHRLEGCWYGDGGVYFTATYGGDAVCGQVWHYRPEDDATGELELIFESPGKKVLEHPDNICVSPRGGVVVCEDGKDTHFIRGLTRDGRLFDLVETNGPLEEFTGACFSPDGDILFFNIQGSTTTAETEVGYTFAMWGPWADGGL